MRILVTGANGYLGQGIVKTLLDKGCNVIATDIRDECIDNRADIRVANIFQIADAYDYFNRPEVVLHLAWRDGFQHDSCNHIYDLPAHYEFLLKFMKSDTKRVCVLGSMHEVGFFEGSIDDNTPTNPQSLYGISKNALRQMMELEALKYKKQLQWIRGFYIVGNTEYGSSVFSKITKAVKDGRESFPFTRGQNQFDFIDYEEFCQQVAEVCFQDRVLGIINCCSGKPMKLCERVERFIKDNNYNINLEYGSFPDRPYDSKAIWGNDRKIRMIMERRKDDNF